MAENKNPNLEEIDSIKAIKDEIYADTTDEELHENAKEAAEAWINAVISMQKKLKKNNPNLNYEIVAYHFLNFTGTVEEMRINAMKKYSVELYKIFKARRDKIRESDEMSGKKTGVEISVNAQLLGVKRDLLEKITEAIGVEKQYRREEKLSELLELDTTKVIIKSKSNGSIKSFPVYKFAVDKVLKGKKVILSNDKQSYIVSADAYKKILRESARPYNLDRYTNERYGILKKLKNQIKKLEAKVNEENELIDNNPWINEYINENPGKSVDEYLNVIRKRLKEKEYEVIDKENAKLKILANEVRDRARRLKIQSNRQHYNPLQFLGKINTSSKKDIDKLIEKQMKIVARILKNTKRRNGKIAIIGTQQKLSDSEHIHRPSENTVFDKYSVQGGRSIRRTQSVPKAKVEQWYKETLDLDVTLIPEWKPEEYEIIGVLKPAYVPNTTTKWKEKKSNGTETHEVDAGSLLAATYFYTLVSNTPIDEPYMIRDNGRKVNYWDRARIALKKNKNNHNKNSENKTLQEIVQELKERESKITKTRYKNDYHIPDEESVRGDWVLYFRGKTFKAFITKPASNSKSVANPIYFTDEDFMNPVTDSALGDLNNAFNSKGKIKNSNFKPYIWHIAEVIAKNTDTNSDDISIKVENVNPRWQILEYGGYKSDKSGPWQGSGKYGRQHGVNSDGFSYQAPRGFKRIVDAQYNAIMTKSALYNKAKGNGEVGSSTAYTRGNRSLDWNMDITKMNESQFSSLMDKLMDQDKTLSIENIHTIDGSKVWKWESAK